MRQCDNVSIEAGDADGALLDAAESGGASAVWNSVMGVSWCSVETGSSAGGASGITVAHEDSGAEASGSGATGCGSIRAGNETGSDSRAGSTGSDRGGTGRSTVMELGMALKKVGGSSGRKGVFESRTAVGCGRSDSLITSVSAIDSLTSLKLKG